jgi:hypothetical protein
VTTTTTEVTLQVQRSLSFARGLTLISTVTPAGQIRVVQADGTEIHHVVSMLGRVSSCPHAWVRGLKAC